MYAFIRGKVFETSPTSVIIDANGVGYHIHIPPSTFADLPPKGKEALLHTSFVVREQSQALYGFLSPEEKELFERLLTISGIGPKTALSLIGHLPLDRLKEAIQDNDATLICKVPGIGKKTAERLLIEMRDKVSIRSTHAKNPTARDALSALINLGYSPANAEKAIEKTLKANKKMDLAELITASLKNV